jgi:hypothetical protein
MPREHAGSTRLQDEKGCVLSLKKDGGAGGLVFDLAKRGGSVVFFLLFAGLILLPMSLGFAI